MLCLPHGDLPDLGIELKSLTSPALAGWFFTTSATWEAPLGMGTQCIMWDGGLRALRVGLPAPQGCGGISSEQGWPAPLPGGSPGEDPGPLSAQPQALAGLPAHCPASHTPSPHSRKSGSFTPQFSAPSWTQVIKRLHATMDDRGFCLPPAQKYTTCSFSCFKAQSTLSGSPLNLPLSAQDRASSFRQLERGTNQEHLQS